MDYFHKYNKYKSKYLNLKKTIGGASLALSESESLKNDIISLQQQDNIENIYHFEIEGTTYFLIGEEHNKKENEEDFSFAKIYEKLLKNEYTEEDVEVFIESSINNQDFVGIEPKNNIVRKTGIKIIDSLRDLTKYESSFQTTFFDIRDNSHFALKKLIYEENTNEINKQIDIKSIIYIINSMFLITLDTYSRYMMKLIKLSELEKIGQTENFHKYFSSLMIEIEKKYDYFQKLDLQNDTAKRTSLNTHFSFPELSRITSQVINPLMLYKMLISKAKIKILYCGANHSKSVFSDYFNKFFTLEKSIYEK